MSKKDFKALSILILWGRNYLFLEIYLLQREPFLTVFKYYQHLSFARYQVRFYASN